MIPQIYIYKAFVGKIMLEEEMWKRAGVYFVGFLEWKKRGIFEK